MIEFEFYDFKGRVFMFIFKKIVCRAYQIAFRAVLPVLPYREPKIMPRCEDIADVLIFEKAASVLVVTDVGIVKNKLLLPVEDALKKSKVNYVIYDKTQPNPTVANVEEALDIYHQNKCDALIAIGGGSSIDCAKAIGARVAYAKRSLDKLGGKLKVWRRIPTLIAIPTTAGTGSETTVAAVITDAQTHHKYVINDFCLIPHYALLDAQVTVGLPKHLTSTTGMDALTHAVEAYIGKSRTKATKLAAEKAVKLIFENLELAYQNGGDIQARKNMLYASYLAGTAFTKSYVGYVHAVAHTLGGKYGVPHGLANAILLPKVLRAYKDGATKPLAQLAKAVGLVPSDTPTAQAAEAIIAHIEGMNERMQIPTSFDCINKDDIPAMAKLADKEANPLYPVPVLWDAKQLQQIYHLVCAEQNN